MTAPLLPLAAAFALGIGLGLTAEPPGWLPITGIGLAALAVGAAWRDRLAAATAALLLLAALAGWARTGLPDPWPVAAGLTPGVQRLEGLLLAEPETEGPRTRLALLVETRLTQDGPAPARGRLVVQVYGAPPPVRAADRVRVTAELRPVRPFQNPGSGPGLLDARRPPTLLALARPEAVEVLPRGEAPWWLRVRLGVHEVVRAELPPVSGALLEGLLLGERRALPPTLQADFRAAGVYHVLAISGFNVALVAGTVVLILRLLRVPPRGAAAVALPTLLAFAAVVGAEPSVLRATIMGLLVWGAELLGRESRAWNGLAAALLLLLGLEPASLADPGLQLSFAATAGILHLTPPISRSLAARAGWAPRPLTAAIGVSAGAQLAVTPLMVLHWSQLAWVGPLANLVVVPLAGAVTTLGFLALLVAPVAPAVTHLLTQGLWALLIALRLTVRAFAALPGALLSAPAPPGWALAAAVLTLVLLPWARRPEARLALVAAALAGAAGTAARALPDGRLHVLALDVGQGEAILVRGPDGASLLVDAGGGGPGRADRGERVVLPVLRRAGISRLRAVALTHGDPDHAGGLLSVLDGVHVDEVWLPAGDGAAGWGSVLTEAGLPWRALARGDRLWLGPLRVSVLHPPGIGGPGPPPPPGRGARDVAPGVDPNHGSLVLRLDWGLASVLLTGDAEAPAERELLEAGDPLRSLVLKVGHHGSRHATSAAFVDAVAPRVAVISAGAGNPFGHPSPAVLARLAGTGAAVYRTDLDGAVEVASDGATLEVRRRTDPALAAFPLRGAP